MTLNSLYTYRIYSCNDLFSSSRKGILSTLVRDAQLAGAVVIPLVTFVKDIHHFEALVHVKNWESLCTGCERPLPRFIRLKSYRFPLSGLPFLTVEICTSSKRWTVGWILRCTSTQTLVGVKYIISKWKLFNRSSIDDTYQTFWKCDSSSYRARAFSSW